jgi:hypothetical protein
MSMSTTQRDQTVARLAIIGMSVCSGSRGNTLVAGTSRALEALERLGASADYRDATDDAVSAVCDAILDGTIRCNDAMWFGGMDGTILPRLARLALRSVAAEGR